MRAKPISQASVTATEFDKVQPGPNRAPMARRVTSLGVEIAKRLKRAQKARNLTVRQLAVNAHVSPPTIQRMRDGQGHGCSVGTLYDVAKALNVSPCWLVYGGPPEPEFD